MTECKLDKEDEMAKIEPEKRASLTEVKKGKDVTELKFKMSINGEDMHYPGEMISGCKLMENASTAALSSATSETAETADCSYAQREISSDLYICWMLLRSYAG